MESNRAASRTFHVDERWVHEWREKEDNLWLIAEQALNSNSWSCHWQQLIPQLSPALLSRAPECQVRRSYTEPSPFKAFLEFVQVCATPKSRESCDLMHLSKYPNFTSFTFSHLPICCLLSYPLTGSLQPVQSPAAIKQRAAAPVATHSYSQCKYMRCAVLPLMQDRSRNSSQRHHFSLINCLHFICCPCCSFFEVTCQLLLQCEHQLNGLWRSKWPFQKVPHYGSICWAMQIELLLCTSLFDNVSTL